MITMEKMIALFSRMRGQSVLLILSTFFLTLRSLHADQITYDWQQFDSSGSGTTPLLNLHPDVGSAAFTASFTSSPTPDAFGPVYSVGSPFFAQGDFFHSNALFEFAHALTDSSHKLGNLLTAE